LQKLADFAHRHGTGCDALDCVHKQSGSQRRPLVSLLAWRNSINDFDLAVLDECHAKRTGSSERDSQGRSISAVRLQQTGKRWRNTLSGLLLRRADLWLWLWLWLWQTARIHGLQRRRRRWRRVRTSE
jgi:hypothetical protein